MGKIQKTSKKRLKIVFRILKVTGASQILDSYLVFVFMDAALIWIFEPTIKTYMDSLWYCYAVISTAGFGDVVVTAFIPKVLSVLLTIYSLLALAIFTGVVVNFFNQTIDMRNKETLTAFLDELERLPEMNEEELKDLSERVKHFRQRWG